MEFRHRTFLRVGSLILSMVATFLITGLAIADGEYPRYEATVGGVAKNLTLGMEVAQGSLLDDGSCDFSGPLVITGRPTKEKNSGLVTVSVTKDCSLVVSNLQWDNVSSDSGSRRSPMALPAPRSGIQATKAASAPAEFIGYVDSFVTDWVGIEVNSVEAGIQYFDDGSTVSGGHSGFHDWRWFKLSGWVKDSGASGEFTTGLNVISTWTEGEFHNDNCPHGQKCRSKHRGTFFTYPGDSRWHCTVYVIHWALRHSCSGERIEVAD